MSDYKYTVKEENFCQAYVRLGVQISAYKEAFDAKGMKDNSIYPEASRLLKSPKIAARVRNIKIELENRNKITIDELVNDLANMVRFDPSEMYDSEGKMKLIHDIPLPVRQMMNSLDTEELFKGKNKELVGYVKKAKFYNKLDAIEKLLKHLGGYEKDNKQKVGTIVEYQIPNNNRDTKNIEDDDLY